ASLLAEPHLFQVERQYAEWPNAALKVKYFFLIFFKFTALWRHPSLAAMRPGDALIIHRFAAFSPRAAIDIACAITRPAPALVAGVFFAVVVAAQAQDSVQEAPLPAWSEPSSLSAEPLPAT